MNWKEFYLPNFYLRHTIILSMRNILLIGAGRSSTFLIKYFLDQAQLQDWMLTVADVSLSLAQSKTTNHSRSSAIAFDINN